MNLVRLNKYEQVNLTVLAIWNNHCIKNKYIWDVVYHRGVQLVCLLSSPLPQRSKRLEWYNLLSRWQKAIKFVFFNDEEHITFNGI